MKSTSPERTIKVVIDTNVLISAGVSKDGNPAQIFELLLIEAIENYTSEEIILEVIDVFNRPKFTNIITGTDKKFIINKYKFLSKNIIPKQKFNIVKDDPKDNKFIDCAVEANAEFLISGDPHLLEIKKFQEIKVVSPKEFLENFKTKL